MIVFFLIFGLYIFTVYSHINTYFAIIQISNEAISKDKGKYIFDIVFSKPFDNLLLILKIIVGIEYSYTTIKNKIDFFSVSLNILLLLLILVISLKFSFQVTSFKKLDFYIFNKNLNITRMFITIFNVYFVIVTTIFYRENTEGEYVLGSKGIELPDKLSVDFKVRTPVTLLPSLRIRKKF